MWRVGYTLYASKTWNLAQSLFDIIRFSSNHELADGRSCFTEYFKMNIL